MEEVVVVVMVMVLVGVVFARFPDNDICAN